MEEKVKCKNCTFEMIEEMAKVIRDTDEMDCGFSENCDECLYCGHDYCDSITQASIFYDEGYRKIPEGSVVLTREEYEQDLTAQYDCGYEFGQKETAKEIYLEMIGEFEPYIATEIAKEIAKKYGVEVEE